MRIEVGIDRWEQQCCGQSFRTGDSMTWTVKALDPAEQAPGGLPRYHADNHGQIPDEVPAATISGEVVAIRGVSYPHVEMGASSQPFRIDLTRPTTFPLTSVGRSPDDPLDEYLVTLEVADDVELPTYALSTFAAELRRAEEQSAALSRARLDDEVGAALEALGAETEARYSPLAEISRSTDHSASRMIPHRHGATAIRWSRSESEEDGIQVTTGEGQWFLPATQDGVAQLRAFVDAAAAGRVHESVEQGAGRMHHLRTRVDSGDRSWTSTTDYEGPDTSGGWFMVAGNLWGRVKRGDHTYAPWGDAPPRH